MATPFQLPSQYTATIENPDLVLKCMWEQYCHDRLFHTDIFHMPLIAALSHHALHLVKYLGILTETEDTEVQETRLVDTLSTIMSMLGRLNVKLVPLQSEDIFTLDQYWHTYATIVAAVVKSMEHAQHTNALDPVMPTALSHLYQHTASLLRASGDPIIYKKLMIRRSCIQSRSIFSISLVARFHRDCRGL